MITPMGDPVETVESVAPGRYRHFKGEEYEVLIVGTHTETKESVVVYRSAVDPEAIWVRPLAMFTETVERHDGTFSRFESTEDRKTLAGHARSWLSDAKRGLVFLERVRAAAPFAKPRI